MEIKDIISSGLLELYSMGLVTEKEAAQVEQWAKTYPEVMEELKSIQLLFENYAQSNAIAPSKNLKEKIFSAIQNNTKTATAPVVDLYQPVQNSLVKNNTNIWKLAVAASVILLLGSIFFNILYYNKFSKTNTDLKNTQEQLAYQQQAIGEMKQDMSVVQSKYSKPVELLGVNAAPDAAAKIFWMKNTGEVYIDPSNLPEVSKGKQYQLWAIVDGKPVDAGLIVTSKKGDKYRIQKMKTFGAAEAFAVTLEKEGGSPTPTMEKMYVMGKI